MCRKKTLEVGIKIRFCFCTIRGKISKTSEKEGGQEAFLRSFDRVVYKTGIPSLLFSYGTLLLDAFFFFPRKGRNHWNLPLSLEISGKLAELTTALAT